jgi:DNA-binding CsgD family transcriptional regulator
LTPATVAEHVAHSLQKRGFTRRVQLAVWAVQQRLWIGDAN